MTPNRRQAIAHGRMVPDDADTVGTGTAADAIVSIAADDTGTTPDKRWIRFLESQNELLELIAKGASLDHCLDHLSLVFDPD